MPPNRHNTSTDSCQQKKKSKLQVPCQECKGSLRIVLFASNTRELPEKLREQALKCDPAAVIRREWASVLDTLTNCDVIIDYSDDIGATLRRINEVWRYRRRANHATRPAYIVVSNIAQYSLARFEVERRGARFLHIHDVPVRLGEELKQIILHITHLEKSSPQWLIEYEGNGRTLQVSVSFLDARGTHLVHAEDRLAAELALLITRNVISRSIAGWRNVMMNSPLFKPAGGGFEVPSRTTLRMHIHRDYLRVLQKAFDEASSGYCAKRVIERVQLGEKTVGYRIKGKGETTRR